MKETINKKYKALMKKCFALAKMSKGENMPNPFVGAIVYDDIKDEIISFGYHEKYGQAHAEVNAVNNAKGNTRGKVIIVNLEPCSHYGKTPPCADLIIKSGFKKAVIAMSNPNPIVKNNGIKKLRQAGIEVISGVLEDEARELNKIFEKNILQNKPYVMLKTATTLDSKIALVNGSSKWITNEKARKYVHKLRSTCQAVMSACGTILKDNPNLNVRISGLKSPARIIFDPNNKIPPDYNVFKDDGVRVILINNSKVNCKRKIEQLPFNGDFDKLFKDLYSKGIYSIMTEAGCAFNTSLLKSGEVDEINHFFAPKIFGSGLNFVEGINCEKISDSITLENIKIKKFDDNFLINGKIKK